MNQVVGDVVPVRRALLSVYDKTGLEELARGLHAAGVALVSTGSTAARIAASGVPVTPVEEVTGATLFVVDAGVDTGPIVAQVCVPVLDDDDEESLHERIKVEERAMLVDVVGRMAREGWTVTGRKVSIP